MGNAVLGPGAKGELPPRELGSEVETGTLEDVERAMAEDDDQESEDSQEDEQDA